jgi:glutamate dehydrogenase
MPTQPEQAKSEVLDRIIAMIHDRVPSEQADQAESFTRQFYARVDPADLLQRPVLPREPYVLDHPFFIHVRSAQW